MNGGVRPTEGGIWPSQEKKDLITPPVTYDDLEMTLGSK